MSALKIQLAVKLPQATDDAGNVTEGELVYLDVLANDLGGNSTSIFSLDQSDPTLQTLAGSWIQLESGARISFVGGNIIYDTNGAYEELAEGVSVNDDFLYTIRMANGAISTAEVTITVTGQNDAPVALAVAGTADEDGPAITVVADFSDVDTSDTHSFSVDTAGTLGMVTNNGDGTFGYSANGAFEHLAAGETATDTFTYTVTDVNGASSTETVTISVTGQNDAPVAPVANRDVIIVSASTTAVINADWLLQNDLDPSGHGLSITSLHVQSVSTNWVVNPTLDASGAVTSFTLETPSSASGSLDLTYTISDSAGATSASTVTISLVGPANNGGNTIDLSAADYNFSYIDVKGGHDVVLGGTSLASSNLEGSVGHDVFLGGAGNDVLTGNAGNDVLNGGAGADTLEGGTGSDVLIGGMDSDRFVFRSAGESTSVAPDNISDFQTQVDKIDLSQIDAISATGQNDAFIYAGQSSVVQSHSVSWFHSAGNTIVQADVDGDNSADFQLELTGLHALGVDDFIL